VGKLLFSFCVFSAVVFGEHALQGNRDRMDFFDAGKSNRRRDLLFFAFQRMEKELCPLERTKEIKELLEHIAYSRRAVQLGEIGFGEVKTNTMNAGMLTRRVSGRLSFHLMTIPEFEDLFFVDPTLVNGILLHEIKHARDFADFGFDHENTAIKGIHEGRGTAIQAKYYRAVNAGAVSDRPEVKLLVEGIKDFPNGPKWQNALYEKHLHDYSLLDRLQRYKLEAVPKLTNKEAHKAFEDILIPMADDVTKLAVRLAELAAKAAKLKRGDAEQAELKKLYISVSSYIEGGKALNEAVMDRVTAPTEAAKQRQREWAEKYNKIYQVLKTASTPAVAALVDTPIPPLPKMTDAGKELKGRFEKFLELPRAEREASACSAKN